VIKTYFYKLFLTLILLLVHGDVYADQHEPVKPEGQTEENTTPQQPSSSTQEINTPSESFMPTETISEDLSVPFPVDI
jgi:hypothetical protein